MAASPPLHDAASLEKAGPGDALPRAVSPQPSVVFDADAEARLGRGIGDADEIEDRGVCRTRQGQRPTGSVGDRVTNSRSR